MAKIEVFVWRLTGCLRVRVREICGLKKESQFQNKNFDKNDY